MTEWDIKESYQASKNEVGISSITSDEVDQIHVIGPEFHFGQGVDLDEILAFVQIPEAIPDEERDAFDISLNQYNWFHQDDIDRYLINLKDGFYSFRRTNSEDMTYKEVMVPEYMDFFDTHLLASGEGLMT